MANTNTNKTFRIESSMMNLFVEKLAKLQKKAVLLGLPMPGFEEVGRSVEPAGEGLVREYIHIELRNADPIRVNGWTFIATLDMELGEDNIIVRAVPGADVPAYYRTRGNLCDHCQANRRRKNTFLVQHESMDIKQVGSTCLHDFLGGVDPKAVTSQVELMVQIGNLAQQASEGFGMGPTKPTTYDLVTYLAFCAKAIRENGWVSRGKVWEAKQRGDYSLVATADRADRMMGDAYTQ